MRSKAPLVLMEQLVMVLVFALAAAVCLRLFVGAENIAQETARRDEAVIVAQNAAELLKAGYSEEEAARILSEPEVTAIADLHMGDAEATAWGCDLTHEYVSINADYRS